MIRVNITFHFSPSSSLSLDLLSTLKTSTSLFYIPIRFTLFNRITSLGHCLCSSLSSSSIQQKTLSYSSSSTIIKRETIDQILSTCSLIPPPSSSVILPCLSLSSYPSELSNSISIVNLLTPPLSHSSSSYLNENNLNDQSIFDEITSQFGEICPPLPKITKSFIRKTAFSIFIISST
ncbi:unnamed protein product [Rotaria sp. Silwood1]|nr:unnamed protein product [Rotaria sp. Silwood1]